MAMKVLIENEVIVDGALRWFRLGGVAFVASAIKDAEIERLRAGEEKLRQLVAYLKFDADQNPGRNRIGPCAEIFLDEPAYAQAVEFLNQQYGSEE